MRGLGRELAILFVIGMVTAALALLFKENRLLKAENERLGKLAFDPRPGLFVPSVPVPRLHGDSAILGELGESQLLFFFNSICPHCRTSIPAWNEIADHLRTNSKLRVLGVAFDDSLTAEAYRSSQGVRFDMAPVPARLEMKWIGKDRVIGFVQGETGERTVRVHQLWRDEAGKNRDPSIDGNLAPTQGPGPGEFHDSVPGGDDA